MDADMRDETRIRAEAHRIWEERGRPDGEAEQHWHEAERRIGNGGAFRPVDAAEVPPMTGSEPGRAVAEPPSEAELPSLLTAYAAPDAEPNVRHDPGQGGREPVSEADTIRRTLETPRRRADGGAPAGDPEGAMSGLAGRRR